MRRTNLGGRQQGLAVNPSETRMDPTGLLGRQRQSGGHAEIGGEPESTHGEDPGVSGLNRTGQQNRRSPKFCIGNRTRTSRTKRKMCVTTAGAVKHPEMVGLLQEPKLEWRGLSRTGVEYGAGQSGTADKDDGR